MGIEEIELDVGGTKFKGIWIAVIFSFASTLGGGIWAASEFFSRLDILEQDTQMAASSALTLEQRFNDYRETIDDDLKDFEVDLQKAIQELEDNDVSSLQGKLATLGTNLQTIMEQQRQLLEIQDRIVEVEKQITETETLVRKAELMMSDADTIESRLNRMTKEIEDLWNGLDYLSNPYGSTN